MAVLGRPRRRLARPESAGEPAGAGEGGEGAGRRAAKPVSLSAAPGSRPRPRPGRPQAASHRRARRETSTFRGGERVCVWGGIIIFSPEAGCIALPAVAGQGTPFPSPPARRLVSPDGFF